MRLQHGRSDRNMRVGAQEEPSQSSIAALLRELADGAPPPADLEPAPSQPVSGPPPGVAYLLPGLPPEGSGGSHSLVQEARGLRELGADARICVPGGFADDRGGALRQRGRPVRDLPQRPGIPRGERLLARSTRSPAPRWWSRPSTRRSNCSRGLRRERPEIVCAYYVQDYEPLFAEPRTLPVRSGAPVLSRDPRADPVRQDRLAAQRRRRDARPAGGEGEPEPRPGAVPRARAARGRRASCASPR